MLFVLYFWLGLDLGLVDVALASRTYSLVNIPAEYDRPKCQHEIHTTDNLVTTIKFY